MPKNCPNCGQDFETTKKDQQFYQKMHVPEPPLCPNCRQQRRLAFRNERKLYQGKCGLCQKSMITIYSPDKPYPVYCKDCWWGDQWDPLEYSQDFDFNRPFFPQWQELWDKVPKLGLIVIGEVLNSEYIHDAYRLKNCYLTFDGEQAEDCYYGETFVHLKNCIDFLFLQKSELCYECINCLNCYTVLFSRFSQHCSNSAFLVDCINCKNCIGCVNLHRAEYCIFNKPHSPKEYAQKVKSLNFTNYQALQKFQAEFEKFCATYPKKAFRGIRNEDVSGDNLVGCKDVLESYDCADLRDCKFCTNVIMPANDCYDVNIWGDRLSLAYNCTCVGAGSQNIIASYYAAVNSHNVSHAAFCWHNARDIFGCVALRHKQHCIFNKQYSPEEYEKLVLRITEHMQKSGEYAEFFPIPLSTFGYNETVAQEYYPLTKEAALAKGYKWKDPDPKEYKPQKYQIPDEIKDVLETIVKEILACQDCSKNYKIIPQELKFYQRLKVPIPRKCSDCRHLDRQKLRNPRRLWPRKCQKCNAAVQSTYAPDRPETIYCEKCYLKTII